jgi:hypothetical protein
MLVRDLALLRQKSFSLSTASERNSSEKMSQQRVYEILSSLRFGIPTSISKTPDLVAQKKNKGSFSI